jgi:hypothetical protein
VTAANVSLEDAVAAGDFREDLYYRLAVFTVPLPALRERPRDIDVIARHFLAQSAAAARRSPKVLNADAAAALRSHGWPGNVRELKNVMERAYIVSGDEITIRPEHIIIQHRISRPVTTANPDAWATSPSRAAARRSRRSSARRRSSRCSSPAATRAPRRSCSASRGPPSPASCATARPPSGRSWPRWDDAPPGRVRRGSGRPSNGVARRVRAARDVFAFGGPGGNFTPPTSITSPLNWSAARAS